MNYTLFEFGCMLVYGTDEESLLELNYNVD